MNDGQKDTIVDVCEKMDTHASIIRFQVLNNLDSLLN